MTLMTTSLYLFFSSFQVAANSGTSALVTKSGELYLFGKDSSQCDWSGHVIELKGQQIVQVAMGKAHVVALTKEGEVFTFGMNNKGQCGRDFPTGGAAKGDFQLPTASSILASNVEAPEDINSDHDLDTEHESSLSEVICPNVVY